MRSQESHLPALEAMYLLGRYVEQAAFDAAEEDNHGYYADHGLVDATMTCRRALSLSLMAADFFALGQDHDAVLVMLGVDDTATCASPSRHVHASTSTSRYVPTSR